MLTNIHGRVYFLLTISSSTLFPSSCSNRPRDHRPTKIKSNCFDTACHKAPPVLPVETVCPQQTQAKREPLFTGAQIIQQQSATAVTSCSKASPALYWNSSLGVGQGILPLLHSLKLSRNIMSALSKPTQTQQQRNAHSKAHLKAHTFPGPTLNRSAPNRPTKALIHSSRERLPFCDINHARRPPACGPARAVKASLF